VLMIRIISIVIMHFMKPSMIQMSHVIIL
jgi:hypothetical protein